MRLFVFASTVLAAAPGIASGQSILERVLAQIDGANMAPINGMYANIAESIGAVTVVQSENGGTVYTVEGAEVTAEQYQDALNASILNEINSIVYTPSSPYIYEGVDYGTEADALTARNSEIEGYVATEMANVTLLTTTGYAVLGGPFLTEAEFIAEYGSTDEAERIGVASRWTYNAVTYTSEAAVLDAITSVADGIYGPITPGSDESWTYDGISSAQDVAQAAAEAAGIAAFELIASTTESSGTILPSYVSFTIDGSITNLVEGVTAAAAEVVTGTGSATVFDIPTVDLGNMTTTVLGAVNTGEITLGVNSAVDEAGTASARAISAAVAQIGGSSDTGALVLNVSHNASAVNGSLQNTMMAVNGSVGNLATTTLGAVNTGTITSGVNAAVNGIVGIAGQSASGL